MNTTLYSFKLPSVAVVNNRAKILSIEAAMFAAAKEGTFEPLDFPLKHTFTEGVYAREMEIAKGRVIVGKIHRHAHLNFISKGHVSVMTEDGVKELRGPCTFVSTPGTKRVVYAHEDTVWTTVHATTETDIEKIEEDIIAKSFEDLVLLPSHTQDTHVKIKEK